MNEYWEIEEGKIDSAAFFPLLYKYFNEATTLFIEGTSISKDVAACYKKHSQEGKFFPSRETIWPRSKQFKCNFTESLLNELSQLASTHAEAELMDHLSIYENEHPVLEWHDSFENAILVSKTISEKTVANFSNSLGLKYETAKFS